MPPVSSHFIFLKESLLCDIIHLYFILVIVFCFVSIKQVPPVTTFRRCQ